VDSQAAARAAHDQAAAASGSFPYSPVPEVEDHRRVVDSRSIAAHQPAAEEAHRDPEPKASAREEQASALVVEQSRA
jgi:hypothetical protein